MDIPTGQFDENDSSVEVFSSQMTLVCVKLTKKLMSTSFVCLLYHFTDLKSSLMSFLSLPESVSGIKTLTPSPLTSAWNVVLS